MPCCQLDLIVDIDQTIESDLGSAVEVNIATAEHYTGPVTVTPSAESQVLATAGKHMDEDITIEPIPNNYGLITWNGSVITVS